MIKGVKVGDRVRYVGRAKPGLPKGFESEISAIGYLFGRKSHPRPMIKGATGGAVFRKMSEWEVIRANGVTTPVPAVAAPVSDELAELRAWKADAIARYPDLGVKPVVLEARKIVADVFGKEKRDAIMRGEHDAGPAMKVAVSALLIGRGEG